MPRTSKSKGSPVDKADDAESYMPDQLLAAIFQHMQWKGWTQAELGKHTGINPATISRIFSRQRQPTLKQMKAMTEACDLDLKTYIESELVHYNNIFGKLEAPVAKSALVFSEEKRLELTATELELVRRVGQAVEKAGVQGVPVEDFWPALIRLWRQYSKPTI